MLRLRKILLCDCLYFIITILVLLITIYRLSIPIISNYNESSTSFIGTITKIIVKDDKVTIYVKNKETIIAYYYLNQLNYSNLKLGDKVEITGIFKQPDTNTTKYLFNYRKYLKRRNIFYLVEISSIKKISNNRNIYYFLKQRLIYNLSNNPYLYTFILGDKSYLNSNVKRSYQSNGISHLFCISGMHTALLIIIINKLLKRFNLNEVNLFIIISSILVIYLLLVGFSSSILRAVLFYIIFSINQIKYFYIKPTNLFLIVLSISLIINPNYIYDIGYLYSYSISFSLIKMSDYLKGNYFKTIFKTSIISLLVSLPITLYNFYEINILSIFYNLIFIPIISIIIFPMSLLVLIIKPLLPIYNYLIIGVERLSLSFSNINFGKLIFKRLPIYIYIIYFLLVMIYFYKPKKIFIYMFFSLLSIHYLIPYLNYSTYMEILDVGQGDSILIHSSNKVILMDTGGKDNSNGVIFFNTINPGLKSLGIKKIDYLILSHGDSDHMGEAINLVNNFKVDKVIFNCGSYNYLEKELIKDLEKKKIKYYSCINELNINKNKFYFLQTKEYDNENDNSNVIYTELNGYKFMFMGDASIYTEQEILNEYNLSNIDVLKVGHHGSKTSSSKEFIDVINPMYSIISVGEDNKYGHPNKEVLENLNNSKIYRTDQDGSIMFKIKNNKLYALLYNHM